MNNGDGHGKPDEETESDDRSSDCAKRKTHQPSDDEIVSSGGSCTGAALRSRLGGVK